MPLFRSGSVFDPAEDSATVSNISERMRWRLSHIDERRGEVLGELLGER